MTYQERDGDLEQEESLIKGLSAAHFSYAPQPEDFDSTPAAYSTHSEGYGLIPSSYFDQPAGLRPSWDQTFNAIAVEMSLRSTCKRAQTGAVIVSRDRQILTTGYNGAPPGLTHCLDSGCLIEGGHCVRALHAEANAILQAATIGVSVKGAVMHCLLRPCVRCCLMIARVGLSEVVYNEEYDTDSLKSHVVDLLAKSNVKLRRTDER